jgi:hypothetical protein
MQPNSRSLSQRDPALAVLMGAIGAPGSDFGAPVQFSWEPDLQPEFWQSQSWQPAYEFGVEPPAPPHPAMVHHAAQHHHPAALHPDHHQMLALWHRHHAMRAHTGRREMLLEPNKGSAVKIERYSFGINTTITLGVVGAPLTLTGQPDVNIRPQRVIMNAPSPGFAIIDEIKVANVSVTVGVQEDAFNYSALAQNSHLDMPTLSPANRATVLGEMTGFIPPGFTGGTTYLFTTSFQGPASVIA